MASSKIIKLNIGGTVFETSRCTLTKYDCMFRGMLESGIPLETNESGCVFIDRDPTHFRLILNFMRDGVIELPRDPKEVQEVLKEAEFYSLQGLVELCHSPPPPLFTSTPPPSYHTFKNREKLFKILMNSSKSVLLHISYLELYPDYPFPKAPIAEFIDKHKDHVELCFQSSVGWDFECYSIGKVYDTEKIKSLMNEKRNDLIGRMFNNPGGFRSIDPEKEAKSFFADLEKWMSEQNFSN